VFSFRIGQKGGQSDAPAVAGDLLLLQTAFPHTLYALDIHHQATPVRWPFARLPNRHAAGLSCCDAKAKPPGRHIRLAGEHATGRGLPFPRRIAANGLTIASLAAPARDTSRR
jgi:hypothetical protein